MALSKIKTSCKLCCFADYIGTRQAGCKLNRVFKYGRRGVEVIPARDNEQQFFLINDKACTAYRTSKWANEKKILQQIPEHEVLNEIQLNYSLFLAVNSDTNLDNLLTTVKSLTIPPAHLYLMNRSNKSFTLSMLQSYKRRWDQIDILDTDIADNKHIDQMILSNRIKTLYYTYFTDHTLVEPFISKINSLVNNDLYEIFYVAPHKNGNETSNETGNETSNGLNGLFALTTAQHVHGIKFAAAIDEKRKFKYEDIFRL